MGFPGTTVIKSVTFEGGVFDIYLYIYKKSPVKPLICSTCSDSPVLWEHCSVTQGLAERASLSPSKVTEIDLVFEGCYCLTSAIHTPTPHQHAAMVKYRHL